MADVTFVGESFPLVGETTVTTSYSKLTADAETTAICVYIDDSTNDGEFNTTGSGGGMPLTKQTYVCIWERPARGADVNNDVYVKSASGTQALHYRVT